MAIQVDLIVFDVMEDMASAGQVNNIIYKGLFRGSDPDPKHNPGYIMMQSSLVLYMNSDVSHS